MIYKGGVSKKEKDDYAKAIRRNVIESMQVKWTIREQAR